MRKTILITGATDGLGKALALLLSKEHDLILCGRNPEKMKLVQSQLDTSCSVSPFCFDLTDEQATQDFIHTVLSQTPHLDVLINNAGANIRKDTVAECSLEDFHQTMQLNCVAPLQLIQGFLPIMKKQQDGLIINILSSCCLYHNERMGVYAASKSAFEALSKTLLKEVRPDNIRVCSVYPGGIDTPFRAVPNHTYLKPETVATMIKACIDCEEGTVHDLVIRPMSESNIQ